MNAIHQVLTPGQMMELQFLLQQKETFNKREHLKRIWWPVYSRCLKSAYLLLLGLKVLAPTIL
jgi:hypothetical protein